MWLISMQIQIQKSVFGYALIHHGKHISYHMLLQAETKPRCIVHQTGNNESLITILISFQI